MKRSMRRVLLLLLAVGGAVHACTPSRPSSFPDDAKVESGQKAWCKMLADLAAKDPDASGGPWPHTDDCAKGEPAASSAFLGRITPCYRDAVLEAGASAPDSASIIEGCIENILATADPGNVTKSELFKARCERQARCQHVSEDACHGAWERLDGMTRALLTSMYNLRAQSEIAACLGDGDCQSDDAAAEDACYQKTKDKLVWLPLSLAHDESLGPKTD